MNWRDFIDSDEKTLVGKPKVKGTRLSIEFLFGRLADGWTESELLENYPALSKESIQAIHAYVYEIIQDGMFYQPINREAA